ncbi:aminotransferase class V-fold PLP-dependent enzyme [Chloroflexi bacterium TSY]|nr:aminotransferase class V-fold PLP-dependent enzyme [Chloroflexi bacterium TSY]
MPKMTVEELRQELPMTREVAYFQTGTYGPATNPVLKTVREVMEAEAHHGPATPAGRASHVEREAVARSQLARLLNVPNEELAIMINTSRAMQLVIHGIKWQPGDELIMTSSEHVSTYGVSHELRNEYGVHVKVIPADQGDDVLLENLSSALTERTKLVCISHISSPDGCLLPVRETADISHEWGAPVVLDVAQTVGQMPVDLAALNCDYVVGSGHKWLLGPMGTGFVVVSNKRLPNYRPNFIPDRNPWTLEDAPTPVATASSRSEIGTYNHALVVGLGKAVEIAESIGLDTIQATAAGLTQTLREGVFQIDRARIITSLEEGKYAGISSLMFDGFTKTDMDALVEHLYERQKVVVKAQWLTAPPDPVKVAMRISVAAYNTQDEVGRLLEGIEEGLRN